MKSNTIFNIIKFPGFSNHVTKSYLTTNIKNSMICNKKQKISISCFSKFFLFMLLIIILQGFNSYIYKFENSKRKFVVPAHLINIRILSESNNEKLKTELKLKLLDSDEQKGKDKNLLKENLNDNNLDSGTNVYPEGSEDMLDNKNKSEIKRKSFNNGKINMALRSVLIASPLLILMAFSPFKSRTSLYIKKNLFLVYLAYTGGILYSNIISYLKEGDKETNKKEHKKPN
ncbi:Plasmodium exported protein, unknown function [Plasmodium gallinaceum]|uniref:Fam-h protein n=1 Tax=Plasmodium gallinaceum TaxID=5849 RepID=A0A1J1GW17_PLAGA|nr:Plasmodium exported protein, unknown function [Plasmodium gallinaceum]CRG95492.1 Plasmodium exported protein, unknown function [Plasmodium gallinaceum]